MITKRDVLQMIKDGDFKEKRLQLDMLEFMKAALFLLDLVTEDMVAIEHKITPKGEEFLNGEI